MSPEIWPVSSEIIFEDDQKNDQIHHCLKMCNLENICCQVLQ